MKQPIAWVWRNDGGFSVAEDIQGRNEVVLGDGATPFTYPRKGIINAASHGIRIGPCCNWLASNPLLKA